MELFEHVGVHATLYGRMLGPQGSARFTARLREALGEARSPADTALATWRLVSRS